ncbi:DUF6020 family protein [Limosilactobacillus fastidiosus]|uniref:Glycosyltransferase RgtA/B/C/D-like domain-containing protein n=1 Tax=Limosilactobacillus fastidiosus TaxID=2759855 RepID=A0ABR6E603_9LACO|nr:DUF6020 family protein [Limosilactobacillus fastidiosus]MBB1062624.1 hypothetical protein [Limosilactobacillus fastidiosus]MCD7083973.1 DUF6020 family protein [Limosilactobacillus fastidiosus]
MNLINLKDNQKSVISALILSLLSTFGIAITIKVNDKTVIGNSIYSLVIFIGLYLLFQHLFLLVKDRRKDIGAIIIALFFSTSLVLGRNTLLLDDALAFSPVTYIKILMITPCWFALVRSLLSYKIKSSLLDKNVVNKITSFLALKHGLIVIWIIIILFWLPYFIAFFPGIYGYDGPVQVNEFITHNINSHHPVLHTYLLGITIGKLKAPWWIGATVYSALQSLVFSFSLAYLVSFLAQYTKALILILGSWIAFMIIPFYPIMAVTTTKNVIFTALFIILEIQFLKIIWIKDYLHNWVTILSFGIISFLSMAFLKQAMIVYILTVLILSYLFKNNRKQLIVTAAIAVGVFVVYSGPFLTSFNVINNHNDALKETLSIPECQMARAIVRHPQNNKSQIREVKRYIPDYRNYKGPLEAISDPVKTTFNAKYVRKDPLKFLKLYLAIGAKYPSEYINAFCRLTVQLWYPDMNKDTLSFEPYYEIQSLVLLPNQKQKTFRKGLFPAFQRKVGSFSCRQDYEKLPILSLLFSAATPLFIIIISAGSVIVEKQKRYLAVFIMPIIFWSILLAFSPVILLRYVLPLISIEGLLLLPLFNNFSHKSERKVVANSKKDN